MTDSEVISKAIEWLELLMIDGEYDQCGGCRFGRYLGMGLGKQTEHDPDCELKATIDGLKRLGHNTSPSQPQTSTTDDLQQ